MISKELNVICIEPESIVKRCFFNIEVERLYFEDKPALNYYQIIKDVEGEPRKFLGIRTHKYQIRNIEIFNDGVNACKSLIDNEVELFYAGVNEEENEFHALLIGSRLDDVLVYQLDQLRKQTSRSARMIDLLTDSVRNKYQIEVDDYEFRKFLHEKLNEYFFLVRVRNGYDQGNATGLNFSIGKYVDVHQMNIITIDYSEKLSTPFGSGFKYSLYDFIALYYKMDTIFIDDPEMIKAVFFDLYDIQLPTNIMSKEDSFYEEVRRLKQKLDVFLQKQSEYSYSSVIDYFIQDVEVISRYGRKEDWKVIKASFLGHSRMQKFKGLANTIIDDVKRTDYEGRIMKRYVEVETFVKQNIRNKKAQSIHS